MLHIITKSMFISATAARVSDIASGDVLLLIADGVYSATHPGLENHGNIYALEEDRAARGLPIVERVNYIGYPEMVALTAAHHPIVTWR